MKTTNNIINSKGSASPRFFKHFLKALGGATVSLGASCSLFLTSAQAASFVTTFETSSGDVTFSWSGEDLDGNTLVTGNELSGPITISDASGSFGWSDDELSDAVNAFEYNTVSSLINLGEDFVLDIFDGKEGIWWYGGGMVVVHDWNGGKVDRKENVLQSTVQLPNGGGGNLASTPEPTLTLGLITLGGLMLGSKRKRKA